MHIAATSAISKFPRTSGRGMSFVELTSPEVTEKTEVRRDRIPLSFEDGNVVTHLGLSLLEGVDSAAFLNELESRDGDVVLGFNSNNGLIDMEDFILGKLCCERFISSARCKLWWMAPEWGRTPSDLSPETQFLLVEMQEGGPYAILLPLIDRDIFRATLRPPKCRHFGDDLVLRLESGDENVKGKQWNAVLYMAAGWDPYSLLDRAIVSAARLSGGARARTEKTVPESLDAFGWCTWDAFYSTVSAKGIAEGLNALKDGGFPPKLLIIDDGWQMTGLDKELTSAPTASLRLPKQEETEAECKQAEEEALAEATSCITTQTADAVMPTLTAMGPHPSASQEDDDEYNEKEEDVKTAVSMIQRVVGSCVGVMMSACLLAYDWLVDKAPPGSMSVKVFTYLANGPMRRPMLNFYAMAGDFSRRLTSVKANGKFSHPSATEDKSWKLRKENLANVIHYLKTELDVAYVYLWHGLSAYWSGVSHEKPDMAKYNPRLLKAKPTPGMLEVEPSLAWNPSVVGGIGVVEKPAELYLDMHDYLKSAGASGVKVDAQAGVGLIGSVLGGGAALAYKWHVALEESVEKHFPGNHVINCMCHSTENLYRMLNTAVARASDDFYPRDPSSITPHIANCAYNSLFLSPLVQPDWDMFQTKHRAADLHAAARAVSGGAVYISDKPGEHDFEILRQLVLPDGSVLRAQLPGRPTRDCLFRNILKDGRTLLKIWSKNHISGIVGVFNLQGASWDRRLRQFKTHNAKPPTLQARVSPKDVECLVEMVSKHRQFCGKYVAYAMRKKQFFVGSEELCLCVQLQAYGSEIVSFTPVMKLSNFEFAAIGFPHLLNGTGAVKSFSGRRVKLSQLQFECGRQSDNVTSQLKLLKMTSGNRCTLFDVSVKGCGEFLMYANKKPVDVWVNSVSVPFEYEEASGKLTIDIQQSATLHSTVQVLFK